MIRLAIVEDVPNLSRLYSDYFGECYPKRSRQHDFQTYRALLETVVQDSRCSILTYEKEGSIVGFLSINRKFSVISGGDAFEIADIYVVPNRRYGGIGLSLLKYVSEMAINLGVTRIELYSGEPDTKNFPNSWYQAEGYRPLGVAFRKNLSL